MKLNAWVIIRSMLYFIVSSILMLAACYGGALAVCGDITGVVISFVFFALLGGLQIVREYTLK